LVIADFPTGFSELALERLASIVTSGPRCGVYTLIHHDVKQSIPSNIDISQVGQSSLILRTSGEGFVADRDGLRNAVFSGEPPPPAELISELLEVIGLQAQEAKRVEVPFASAAPGKKKLWSLSSETGIRVPVGRAGADRLQHLDLGRGTAQHSLIGGRTGSGKSTLFHVMITNTSLWFSPREVEFYLIDFKKGVEFKIFATHGLPHARVIAIESDREFGLSVLQSINRELSRRGELFRNEGVQDLAAFRKCGAEEHLPRTLLVIDEFQEFFTEDDSIARDAALFLDRFVRQGRAFGIHIILGSQTLSGIYTLAKSTLGQMGVRIALQCNESDSHLILSEDNAAARLLARPGDAIYNDMSGLVEGNSPFQVVWLPDNIEEECLGRIAERARKDGWKPEKPTIVFEGNAPAELEKNPDLQALLGRKFKSKDTCETAWVGEANSMKGPTEVSFSAASGSNLLIVGQHREAAFAMACSTVISLAARHAPGDLRIVVLNGGGSDEYAEQFARLAGAIPHEMEVAEPRRIPEAIEELEAKANPSDDDKTPPRAARSSKGKGRGDPTTYLIVFGVHRLRALRQDEDYMFSSDRDAGPPTGERFATILREGPEKKIHSVVWCDSLGNVNRTFSRKTMREFDMRVLFQMSATDSSELVDETTANNLGLHNALLSVESDGSLEKFRPYTIPDAGYLEDIRRSLLKRFSLKTKEK
ncbi:MAG: FtsK/SpoIIIE domain-containing protein, partial [Planctomycetota bacterium]